MNTLEHMTERFELLPEDLQEAIRTFNYDQRLHQIQKKFTLHIDQSVSMEKAMADIVFGDLKSIELTSVLHNELRIDHQKAIELALTLNSEVILPLREHLQKLQEQKTGHDSTETEDSSLREVL